MYTFTMINKHIYFIDLIVIYRNLIFPRFEGKEFFLFEGEIYGLNKILRGLLYGKLTYIAMLDLLV